MGAATPAIRVYAVRADHGAGGASVPADPVTTWIVSPHLLVAQAVGAALRAAGASIEVRPWVSLATDVAADRDLPGTRQVVAIFDEPDGPDVAQEIHRVVRSGDVHVSVIVPGPALAWWGDVLESGAVDVVPRTSSVTQVLEVIDRLHAGEPLMDPELRTAVRTAWADVLDGRRRALDLVATLSPQQRRVLELLAAGHRAGEVAHLMGVAVGTVRSHVKALRAKLGARTQLEAVAMLRRAEEVPAQAERSPADTTLTVPRPRGSRLDRGGDSARIG